MFSYLLSLILVSRAWSFPLQSQWPQTITLVQRTVPKHTRLLSNVSGVSEPLKDQFNGTDLQWFGDIGFGTPPQMFEVVFDTGSFTSEIAGIQCGLECQNQHRFDFTKSSTFVSTNKTGELPFATGGGVVPSDLETLTLLKVADTMTLIGVSVPNMTFFLITNQTAGFFLDPYDGVVGLGFQPHSGIFAALEQSGLPALFSMFLSSNKVGNAELTLGGIDPSKLNGAEPIWAPLRPPINHTNFWSLEATMVVVNGQPVEDDLVAGQRMVFDSGTSNIVMPLNLTAAIYALISPAITSFETRGAFGIPCTEIDNLPAIITFTFTSSSGSPFNLTIPPEEFILGSFREDPKTCQTLINAQDVGGGGIIGGSLLKHYYSVWDVDNARMGFVDNARMGIVPN